MLEVRRVTKEDWDRAIDKAEKDYAAYLENIILRGKLGRSNRSRKRLALKIKELKRKLHASRMDYTEYFLELPWVDVWVGGTFGVG